MCGTDCSVGIVLLRFMQARPDVRRAEPVSEGRTFHSGLIQVAPRPPTVGLRLVGDLTASAAVNVLLVVVVSPTHISDVVVQWFGDDNRCTAKIVPWEYFCYDSRDQDQLLIEQSLLLREALYIVVYVSWLPPLLLTTVLRLVGVL